MLMLAIFLALLAMICLNMPIAVALAVSGVIDLWPRRGSTVCRLWRSICTMAPPSFR